MRTTLDLPDETFRKLKAEAALRGYKLKELVAQFIERGLSEGSQPLNAQSPRPVYAIPIAREADGGIYLHAGPEIGVASTKAFTSQVAVLTLLALLKGRIRMLGTSRGLQILRALEAIPDQIQRILDLGVEVRLGTRIGRDLSLAELEAGFDAVFWAVGTHQGRRLAIPGGDAAGCLTGVEFLRAFNQGELAAVTGQVVVVGGGDTSLDVASVARRLGHVSQSHAKDHPDQPLLGQTAHDVAASARRQGAEVVLTSLFPVERMTAAEREISDARSEGVSILGGVMPLAVLQDQAGRVRAVRLARCTMKGMQPIPVEAVVRGYIIGSGWKDYQKTGAICGIPLPKGLRESDALPEPIYTPATKAQSGHDENISKAQAAELVGRAGARIYALIGQALAHIGQGEHRGKLPVEARGDGVRQPRRRILGLGGRRLRGTQRREER